MGTVIIITLLLLLGGLAPFQAAADVLCDATLPRNTSSLPVYFATTTVGQSPNIVYALAQCDGDVINSTTCGECVASALTRMPEPPDECYEAFFNYGPGGCTALYSRDDILAPSKLTDSPLERWNIMNVTSDDANLIIGLTQQLLAQTVERAASSAPRRVTTGVMDSGTNYPQVYSMAQCTPDLSAVDCMSCLGNLLDMINSTMALQMGAQIHVIRCYFRYEASSFYSSEPMFCVGPSSAPAKEKRKGKYLCS
jgi:hypothetical protein